MTKKWLLEIESTLGKDAMNIVEMTTKELGYDITLVYKTMVGFERIDSSFCRTFYYR